MSTRFVLDSNNGIFCPLSGSRFYYRPMSMSVALAFCILALAAATDSWAQDTNAIAALQAQMQIMKQQHDAEIQSLEKRLDEIQRGGIDQMHLSQEGVNALTDFEKDKEKGKIETYYDKSALEAYEDTLPKSVLQVKDTLHTRLFDYLSKGFEWQGYFRAGQVPAGQRIGYLY